MGSFFGKLFAPSRWSGSTVNRTYLKRIALATKQLDATSNTIPCTKTAAFDALPASGTVYMGGETITYTGKSTQATNTTSGYLLETLGTFTGCDRGLYPAIAEPRGAATTSWGKTFEYPRVAGMVAGDVGQNQPIADEPFSFVGRMVALYVTTWDYTTNAWHSVDDAQLVWVGRIADSITFDPSTGAWSLNCDHILGDLERKLCSHLPTVSALAINLNGAAGRTFVAAYYQYDADATTPQFQLDSYRACTIAAGYYEESRLRRAVTDELNGAYTYVSTGATNPTSGWLNFFVQRIDDKTQIRLTLDYADSFYERRVMVIYTSVAATVTSSLAYTDAHKTTQSNDNPCHAFSALGFDLTRPIVLEVDDQGVAEVTSENSCCSAYQPLHANFNGSKLLAVQRGTDAPWDTQGDYESVGGGAYACLTAKAGDGDADVAYTAATLGTVTVLGAGTPTALEFTLAASEHQPAQYMARSFVGETGAQAVAGSGGARINAAGEWKQVWHPKATDAKGVPVGPIRQLLPSLLSTGTTHYNDAGYDHAPAALSCCIPSALIDKASFLRADARIRAAYPVSSLRKITRVVEPTAWMDLFMREARAYGYCLAWDASQAKIVCHPVFDVDQQDITVALTEADTAAPDDFPSISMSVATVINQWSCTLGNNEQSVILEDRESIEGLDGIVKTAKVIHPGISTSTQKALAATVAELQKSLMQASAICRYPLQRIRRSLAPTRSDLVSVADLVSVVYTVGYQDPGGTGARTLNSTALVLDVSWNFESGAGSCDLLVLPPGALPWAPSALVDIAAANAGWTVGTKTLTLIANAFGEATDSHDGAAFADGYKIQLINRAPADPTSVTPIAATVASYTPGTLALVIDEDISASFDTTGETEYVIVPADWADAVAAQRLVGTWQAGNTTHILGASDEANIYG